VGTFCSHVAFKTKLQVSRKLYLATSSRWSWCGGGVGSCGLDGVLEQAAIILSRFYQVYPLRSHFFWESMINTKP
jgi:hypothetical protein